VGGSARGRGFSHQVQRLRTSDHDSAEAFGEKYQGNFVMAQAAGGMEAGEKEVILEKRQK
jgi:hypothetical protein